MKQFFKDEQGNILVFSALATFALMAFASIAIDVGCMLTAKNQLQSAVDASALAGASGLMQNQTEAIETALNIAGQNTCLNQSITLGMGNIHFPTYNQVQVQASQTVDLYFAKVLGMETAQISAMAAAEIGTIISTRGMKPWAVPDIGYQHGQSVVIKSGSLGAPATVPSFFYPIDFPPLNRGTPVPGANEYMENVMHGSSGFVGVNDIIQVEPGNMVGPTKKGVEYLIAQEPGAYLDGKQVNN